VANVRPFAKMMAALPHYITDDEGGYGFAELAETILAAKAHG
jgi:hypothetical protein